MENYFSNIVNWQSFPVFWLTIVALAFWLGLFLDDLQNKDSWIWQNIREWRKLFIVEAIPIVFQTTEEREWLEVRLRIKFRRRTKALRLTINVRANINLAHTGRSFVLNSTPYEAIEPDQQETFTVAILPLSTFNGSALGYTCWGSRLRLSGDVEGMRSLSEGTENLLSVRARAGWRSQEEKFFLAVMHKNSQEYGRLFIRQLPLDTGPSI